MSNTEPISLTVVADPSLARLVRMSASNVGLLSSMSVERVEDIRMAAEEAFIYACSAQPGEPVTIDFSVDDAHVCMEFKLHSDSFVEPDPADPTTGFVDLILGSVCDNYEKRTCPATLVLNLEADVR